VNRCKFKSQFSNSNYDVEMCNANFMEKRVINCPVPKLKYALVSA